MALTYQYLSDDDKLKIAEEQKSEATAVNSALVEAWEIDHYAHSLRAASETDPADKKPHEDAMKAIEDAIAKLPK